MKLTKWIKCRVQQPTLPGWYDVRYHGEKNVYWRRIYWNGRHWDSYTFSVSLDAYPNDAWRGLAEAPKGE